MRSCIILALFGLTIACGSSDDAGEVNGPSITVETAVVNAVTATDTTTDSNMPEPPTFRTTVLVPPDSEIKNEGDVLLEVRTAEGELDTAWVAETSGYPEVDEFAMEHLMSLKESGHYFSLDPMEQAFLFRLINRQHSDSDVV